MKGKKPHTSTKAFLPNIQEVKDQAIQSLRNSFEIEGVFFSDEEIRQMVDKVRQAALVKS